MLIALSLSGTKLTADTWVSINHNVRPKTAAGLKFKAHHGALTKKAQAQPPILAIVCKRT